MSRFTLRYGSCGRLTPWSMLRDEFVAETAETFELQIPWMKRYYAKFCRDLSSSSQMIVIDNRGAHSRIGEVTFSHQPTGWITSFRRKHQYLFGLSTALNGSQLDSLSLSQPYSLHWHFLLPLIRGAMSPLQASLSPM